jgi:hypothetical protein
MAMKTLYLRSVGLSAPGLPTWSAAQPVLRGEQPHVAADPPPYQPQLLPPNERRRATPAIRQAFRAAEDATTGVGIDPATLASVFVSSDADLGIIHRISGALAEPTHLVSPTDFHNSVHNAASGYWSIATQNRLPSTTLCAYDASFAAGLIEAATLSSAEALDTLLVSYDVPGPPVLDDKRHFACAASCALILSARAGHEELPRLSLSLQDGCASSLSDPALEGLRLGNPALRALPLLQLLACGDGGYVFLEAPAGCVLRVDIEAGRSPP